MSLSYDYISFVKNTAYDNIPSQVIELAKKSLIDTIGVMCFGMQSTPANYIQKYVNLKQSPQQATAIGFKTKISVQDAALVNGFLGHIDDYDECSLAGHTAISIVPAALAVAEQLDINGKEFLHAYCLGMELIFKVAKVAVEEMQIAGWHTTPVIGILGATAASAILAGLDDKAFANALGISASKASGLIINFGTTTKPYQVGAAASNGVESFLLAQAGLNANPDAFEGTKGYFSAFLHHDIDASLFDWNHWSILENAMHFKQYPCCFGSHSSIAALKNMLKRHSFGINDVQSIRVGLSPYSFSCMSYPQPQNAFEAKFSISFPLGVILKNGELRTHDFMGNLIKDDELQQFMPKVSIYIPDKWKHPYAHKNSPSELTVTLNDGNILEESGELYFSSIKCWDSMITDDKLKTKFIDCTESYLGAEQSHSLFQSLMEIDASDSIAAIMGHLRR